MENQILRIDQIQTTDIIYFDEDRVDKCYEFCRRRNIDCLPSLDSNTKLHQRNDENGNFDEISLPETRIVDKRKDAFAPDLRDKFRDHGLLFVHDCGTLTGVVHFSDYNREAVSLYLYALISAYERVLRRLLIQVGELTNDDMLRYFQEKNRKDKVKWYNKHKTQLDNLPDFHRFYLRELILLACDRNVVSIDHQVVDVRNKVMHASDFVGMEDVTTDDYIYSLSSFEGFFDNTLRLIYDYKKVRNRLAFHELD